MRRKIYYGIYPFLTDDNLINQDVEAYLVLKDFIDNKLPYYAEFKNNPSKNILSGYIQKYSL